MYKIRMVHFFEHGTYSTWCWYVHGSNGQKVLKSKNYSNRTQCRNVMMEFSRLTRMPYKEIE